MPRRVLRIETYRFGSEGECYSYLPPNKEIVGIAHCEKGYDRERGDSWEVDLLVIEEVVEEQPNDQEA